VKNYDKYDTFGDFDKIEKPKVARFRQTTHHTPRNTRRDKVTAARVAAEQEG
jgi:hypothetical protein